MTLLSLVPVSLSQRKGRGYRARAQPEPPCPSGTERPHTAACKSQQCHRKLYTPSPVRD